MNKKQIIIIIIGAIFLGSVMFFAGARWQSKKVADQNSKQQSSAIDGKNEQSQVASSSTGDIVQGELTAKDDASFMLKQRDGSLKKIMFSDSMQIKKNIVGRPQDLNIGDQISVNGKNNPDGTLSAQRIIAKEIKP